MSLRMNVRQGRRCPQTKRLLSDDIGRYSVPIGVMMHFIFFGLSYFLPNFVTLTMFYGEKYCYEITNNCIKDELAT
jgi:hypothetical protein